MELINLTPHDLNIFLPDDVAYNADMTCIPYGTPVLIIPRAGFVRVTESLEERRPLNVDGVEVPVVRKVLAPTVDGLPGPKRSTAYVVSYQTAQAVPGREDVFFPGEAVRDAAGNIVGCVGLAHV